MQAFVSLVQSVVLVVRRHASSACAIAAFSWGVSLAAPLEAAPFEIVKPEAVTIGATHPIAAGTRLTFTAVDWPVDEVL